MCRLSSLKRAPQKGALFTFWGWCILGFLYCQGTLASSCLPFQPDEWAKVSHVFDGDTVKLADGRKVRFIGINTPEIGYDGEISEPLAEEARLALQALLGKEAAIALRYGREKFDRHGRLLAHVYLADQTNVQQVLLEQGLAAAIAIAPNVANQDCYHTAERRAQKSGIWQQDRYKGMETSQLARDARGFYIIKGLVERVGESRKSIWLNFPANVAVRIDKKDLHYFEGVLKPGQLQGAIIKVRGWLYDYRGALQMRIYHPSAIEVVEK